MPHSQAKNSGKGSFVVVRVNISNKFILVWFMGITFVLYYRASNNLLGVFSGERQHDAVGRFLEYDY
jgi:hypothetical protein